jgi:polyribonucleotide nucleotidyltransferase
MAVLERTVTIDGKKITLQTGKIAKQASGAFMVSCGDSVVLVTAVAAKEPREGVDFLPLTVDYQEKTAAAGKIPGGFFKREGRPREEETLVSRIIDRSTRPLFPEGWGNETQLIATVFSADPDHPTDSLAMIGASAALHQSDIPFAGPIAGLRVARVDGRLVVNPGAADRDKADIDLFLSCSESAITMVEGGAKEASEAAIIDALLFGFEQCQPLIAAQRSLREAGGLPKRSAPPPAVDAALLARVTAIAAPKIAACYDIHAKLARYEALDRMKRDVMEALAAEDDGIAARKGEVGAILSQLKYDYVRRRIVNDGVRIGGRGTKDIREISCEVGVLPRTHGSALFTRGETQALVTVTLGTRQDEQRVDGLHADEFNRFMLHYNFPPYSVGEAKMMRSASRRELGHGALARRSLVGLVDLQADFPYTVRIVSDITESNGSSSMASVCGGSLALFDAGAPLSKACAGIAMGLIKEGDKMAILSDILGDEDHLGDMDFKVTGTRDGVTAIQMDIKIDGVSREILAQALEQARQGRLHILEQMDRAIAAPRTGLSDFAPRITTLRIKPDRIRDVIGPGGKVIRDIVARTGAQVDVEDDGTVTVASTDGEGARRAIKMIEDLTQEAEMGKHYLGHVRRLAEFGAFVEIFPGTDGLIHISELADRRVNRVEDVLREGDEVLVKVIGMEKGKIRLSRKQAIADEKEGLVAAS